MRRTSLVIFFILAAVASACGSDEGSTVASPSSTPSTSSADSDGDVSGIDQDPVIGASDLDVWAGEIASALLDRDEARFSAPEALLDDAGPLEHTMVEIARAEQIASAFVDALPGPIGEAALDAALAALVDAVGTEMDAAAAVRTHIDESGADLLAEIEATPEATGTPLFIGTSLEPLMTAWLRPETDAVEDACLALADLVPESVDVVLDCVGAAALTPDEAEVIETPQLVETERIALELAPAATAVVVRGTNGVQLDGEPGRCLWVGRPEGVADPAGPAGFEPGSPGAMIDLPDDLGPWLNAHPSLEIAGEGTHDVAGQVDVPYWDVVIPGANIFFVFVDSDHPGGCQLIGFEDRVRLHLIPHGGGPVLAVSWVSESVSVDERVDVFDQLDEVLRSVSIVR